MGEEKEKKDLTMKDFICIPNNCTGGTIVIGTESGINESNSNPDSWTYHIPGQPVTKALKFSAMSHKSSLISNSSHIKDVMLHSLLE